MRKVIIVEGKTDKQKLLQILDEPVEIACTYGTLGLNRLEQLITDFRDDDVYVLLDADDSGNKARNLFKREFPNVRYLYTHKMYREVATTPIDVLTKILEDAYFAVKPLETDEGM